LNEPLNESMIGLIEKNTNIIVVKTLSKIHAMAGLRVGYALAHPTVIKKLEESLFNYSSLAVNNLAAAAAMASLKDKEHQLMSKQKNEEARNFTQQGLQALGIHYIPSYTNFIFFPLGNYKGDYAADMLKQNILLRQINDNGKWGRVSIGTLPEMQQFIKVMKENWKG
jgi:histidinol-phosphate aminotransferase